MKFVNDCISLAILFTNPDDDNAANKTIIIIIENGFFIENTLLILINFIKCVTSVLFYQTSPNLTKRKNTAKR